MSSMSVRMMGRSMASADAVPARQLLTAKKAKPPSRIAGRSPGWKSPRPSGRPVSAMTTAPAALSASVYCATLKAARQIERPRRQSVAAEPSATASAAGIGPATSRTAKAKVVETVNSPSPPGSLMGKISPTTTRRQSRGSDALAATSEPSPNQAISATSATRPSPVTAAR